MKTPITDLALAVAAAQYDQMREAGDPPFIDYGLGDAMAALEVERDKMKLGIELAMIHLETNIDIDGNSMKESDAYACLSRAFT